MGLSVITLALARKYAAKIAAESSQKAFDEAVLESVKQSKLYTDEKFSQVLNFRVEIVDSLPLTDIDEHTIYFVKRSSPSGEDDFYYEYMYINGKWELMGSTELDLSGYWTIEQVKAYVKEKEYVLPIASETTLGGVKVNGESIQIAEDGTISVNDDYIDGQINIVMDDEKTISNPEIDSLFD